MFNSVFCMVKICFKNLLTETKKESKELIKLRKIC